MAVGGGRNLDNLKSEALKWHPKGAERAAWAQVFLSLLTQVRCAGEQDSYGVLESYCNHRGDNNKRPSCDPIELLVYPTKTCLRLHSCSYKRSSLASFPSYNVTLGLWGLYSIFTRSFRSTHL